MLRFLWLSVSVILLDQVTKLWILATFKEYEVVVIWPVFNLTLVYNKGAAFSFLANAGGWQLYFFIILALVLSVVMTVWLARLQRHEKFTAWGLGLIIGGAVGNLIDRLLYGKVVDFLQWHWGDYYWPSFNVADSAITIGVCLMLVDAFRPPRTDHQSG
jgi:signal peptidase II